MSLIESVENLGSANVGMMVVSGEYSNDRLYIGTRVSRPATIGSFDLETGRIQQNYRVEGSGKGAYAVWCIKAINGGEDVFCGVSQALSNDGALYNIIPGSEEISPVARFDGQSFLWDMDAAPEEERLYLGTYPESKVFEYDHSTGDITAIGSAVSGEDYARSIAVTEKTVYVGVGSSAHLIAIDRETHEKEDILPGELSNQSTINALAVHGGHLFAGIGRSPNAMLLVIDLENHHEYRALETPETAQDGAKIGKICTVGSEVYISLDGIHRYDLEGNAWTSWHDISANDFFVRNEKIFGIDHPRELWTYTPSDNRRKRIDLEDAGLEGGAQEAQSLAFLDGVYVGGSDQATIFNVESNRRTAFDTSVEPKSMCPVEDSMYLATYPKAILMKYAPGQSDEARELTQIGHDQNRPRDTHLHKESGLLFVGTRPVYGKLGGALATFDTVSDDLIAVDRNIIANQSITGITSVGETLLISSEIHGGGGADPVASAAKIAAVDVQTRKKLWETAPLPDATGLYVTTDAKSITDGAAYAFTQSRTTGERGTFFEFDLATRTVQNQFEVSQSGGELRTVDGIVYGTTGDQLFRYDPTEEAFDVLLDDLEGNWHSTPSLTADHEGNLYVIQDRDLLKVTIAS